MTITDPRLARETTRVPSAKRLCETSRAQRNHPPRHQKALVSMSERTGLSISQVTDEVLYTGLVEMQEL